MPLALKHGLEFDDLYRRGAQRVRGFLIRCTNCGTYNSTDAV